MNPKGPGKRKGEEAESFWASVPPAAPPTDPGTQAAKAGLAPFPSPGKRPPAGIPLLRGAGPSGLTARFKNLKGKDIAFVVAGLSVLILAPIAEHMISSPDDETGGTLQQGFDQKGAGLLGGENPYEPGIANIAAGNLPGQGSEVVTPLNVRDPSSLIMSPGGEEKKAPVQAAAPPPQQTAAPSDGWKDALKAAQKGVSKATEKVHLPLPGGKLAKIGGLGTPSGNTQATLSLAAPSSKGLFSNPGAGNHVHVSAGPGYRGADRRSLASGSGAPGIFGGSRPGPGGPGGATTWDGGPGGPTSGSASPWGGSPSAGGEDKGGGGGGKGSENKNIGINQKEDLAWLRRKMEMEKAVGLKWDKKKYDQLERKKMLEEMAAQTAQQAFMKILDKLLGGGKGGGKDEKKDEAGGKPGGDDSGPSGPSGPGKPGTDNGPGQTPRPQAPGEVGPGLRTDLSALQAVDGQVRSALAKFKADPPAAGNAPDVTSVEGIQSRADRIAQADAKLGESLAQLASVTSPALKAMNPGLNGYPAISSSDPAIRKELEKQKTEMLGLAKDNAQYAGNLKKVYDAVLKFRESLDKTRVAAQSAFTAADKALQDAKSKATEAAAAVEAANKAIDGGGGAEDAIRSAQEAGVRLAEAMKKAQDAVKASVAAEGVVRDASANIAKLQQFDLQVDGMLKGSAAKLDSTSAELLKKKNGFNERIAPLLKAEATAARDNEALFAPSRAPLQTGSEGAAQAAAVYRAVLGAGR